MVRIEKVLPFSVAGTRKKHHRQDATLGASACAARGRKGGPSLSDRGGRLDKIDLIENRDAHLDGISIRQQGIHRHKVASELFSASPRKTIIFLRVLGVLSE